MAKKKKEPIPEERRLLLVWIGQSHLLPGMSLDILKGLLADNHIQDTWEEVTNLQVVKIARAIQDNKLDSDIVPAGLGRVDSLIRRLETREMLG